MLRKTFSGLILIVLLIGILTSTFNIQSVKSEPDIITVPDDYPTIQSAVDAASSSDTIIVRDGTYIENVYVNKDHLTIKSENGIETTIIKAANPDDCVFEIRAAGYVNISGFTVKGENLSEPAVVLDNAFHCNIYNNYITTEDSNVGLLVANSQFDTLSNNTISNNDNLGIYVIASTNITISDNSISRNGLAICVWGGYWTKILNNTIFYAGFGIHLLYTHENVIANNIVKYTYHCRYGSPSIPGGISLAISSDNIVRNNSVSDHFRGICLTGESNHNVIKGNVVQNGGGHHNAFCTYLEDSSGNDIYFNTFRRSSVNFMVHSENSTNTWNSPEKLTYTYNNRTYTNYLGNYWSDYEDKYPDAFEIDDSGIWDTPYVMDENNQDNHPLVNPWTVPPAKFRVGDLVQTTANLNVRTGPGLNYTVIGTMALGTVGQVLGGPAEADGFIWWDIDYAGIVRGWSAENWLELHVSGVPTCVVELQNDGIEISEVAVGEFFDIYVGDSIGDKGIKQVRFSSDNVQDGYPTGRWTEWYDWYVSSEDWNATTKIKRWAFATPGYKEVWAEVKDEIDQTAVCLARIFVPAPALPVLTSPLVITPVKDIYNVGDSLEAEFTIKNIGDTAITLDVLTVGGRLNGFIPPEGAPDFTFQSITLQPNEQYQCQGSLTLTQTGNYRFFITYHIENPTPDEEQLLDENNWNTCVELGEGLTHTDRVKNIIVFEEDIVPDDVIQLRNLINRLKGLDTYIPPYLLDDKSFGGSVATLWIYWKSFFTDTWETYDMHYFAGLDYEYLRVKSLVLAGRSLDSGDIEGARKLVQMSIEFGELSLRSFNGAFEVYDRNVEQAEATARFVKDRCQAIVVAGVTVWNPTAGKALDYTFVLTDWLINRELVGEEQATKILVRDVIVTIVYNEAPLFDGMTLSEYIKVNPSFRFTEMQNYIMNSQILPDIIYDAIKELIAEEAENIAIMISDMLSSAVDYVQAEEFSPVEPRVYDSGGKITGVIGGEVRHEISRSVYYNGTVTIFFPSDIYRYEIAGIDAGTYGLEITSVIAGNVTSLTATDIPTLPNATHQYTIDWNALSVSKEGVTVLVDSDGDGVVERIFSSDSELTDGEFIEKTSPIYPTHTLTITTSEGGTTYPPPETYACSANSTVQVTALPDTDYILDRWELDDLNIGATNPISITMDTNHTMQAVFRVGLHDGAITNVAPSKTIVGQGYNMNINVTAANKGDCTETFNVTVYANTTIIGEIQAALNPTEETTIIFTWNTTGFALGNYTIWVYAEPVLGETNTSDNTLIDGWIFVTIKGDVDGDRDVDIYDVVKITGIYASELGDPQFNPNSDLDGDGEIKIYDVVRCTSHYGQSW